MRKAKYSPRFSALSSPTEEKLPRTSLPGTPSFGDTKMAMPLPGFTTSLVWSHFDYPHHGQKSVLQFTSASGLVIPTASIM